MSSLKCRKCDAKYHTSCAHRIKVCCGVIIPETVIPNLKTRSQDELHVQEENKLLREIIGDKDAIVEDKVTIIIYTETQKLHNLRKDNNDKKQKKTAKFLNWETIRKASKQSTKFKGN